MADNKALYRRWRPQVFADLVGQNHVKQTILNAIRTGKISHAYLFAGPRGTGKTSLARLIAKAVNCLDNQNGEPCDKCVNCIALAKGRMMDLIEIDAASHTSVDDVRNLIEKVNYAPSTAKYKVYIVDEVHMLSKNAFNALLKTLEEPPAHAIFILATTEVHKLPATVISRCQYFDFHYLSHAEVEEQLKKIAKQEKVEFTDEAFRIIADNAEGSLRDAISIMDQAASFADGKVDKNILKDLLGIVDVQVARELTQALIDKNAIAGINLVNETYFKGYDIDQLGKLWLNYLRELLMIRLGNEQLVSKSTDEKQVMGRQANQFTINGIVNLLQRLVEAMNSYKVASLPQLALEMVIAKSCTPVEGSNHPAPVSLVPIEEEATSSAEPGPAPAAKQVVGASVASNNPNLTVPAAVEFTPEATALLQAQLCDGIGSASPSLGAVIKNSRFSIQKGRLCVTVPSQFLKDTLEKSANKILFKEQLRAVGADGLEIEYLVEIGANPAAAVAEVFGIM